MSSIMRCRSGLMALSVMRDAPVLMKVANPSSQDRTPRGAIVLAVPPAAAPYRASGLVPWPNSDVAARKSFNSVPQRRSEAAEALLPGETVSADLDRRLVAVSEAQHEIIADPRNL